MSESMDILQIADLTAMSSNSQPTSLENAMVFTSTCYLRPILLSDAAAISREANNPNVARFMNSAFPEPFSISDAEAFIKFRQSSPHNNFAILKHDHTFVGVISVAIEPQRDAWYRTATLSYWTGQDHWGQGIATNAMKAITEFLFKRDKELTRVQAHLFEDNAACAMVLTKAGFKHEPERTITELRIRHGKEVERLTFGIFREDVLGHPMSRL